MAPQPRTRALPQGVRRWVPGMRQVAVTAGGNADCRAGR